MATTAKTIGNGIRELTYTGKDGSIKKKYQIRIDTKELPKFNVLVENLDVAKEIALNAKSSAGRELLKTLKIKANVKKVKKLTREEKRQSILTILDKYTDEQAIKDVLNDETLQTMLELWFKNHIKKNTTNEVDLRNNRTYELSIKSICNVKVIDWYKYNKIIENVPINLRSMISDPKKVSIGEISIFDLNSRTWLEYINNRIIDKKALSTIAREMSIISSMYNKLSLLGSRYEKIENPVDKRLKAKYKTHTKKRTTRISLEQEIELEKSLKEMRNEDMISIFGLALSTGCRRSEILFWEWENIHIDKNYYMQNRTKNGVPREIKLLPESKTILISLHKRKNEPKTGRLFKYTIDGFKSNWQRVRVKAGLPKLQFRDLRNEFISRFLAQTNNPIVVSSVANIQNQSYFNKVHTQAHRIEQMLANDGISINDVQLQVGHSTPQMTAHYNRTDFNNDGSIAYQIEQLKLKVKYDKATQKEKDELLMLLMNEKK